MKRFCILFVMIFSFTLFSCNEGGVRMTNNMENYAIKYIEENQLLEKDEEILAYYDYTISLNSKEAAILTDKRLIYHNEEKPDVSISLENIENVNHRKESLIGDIIEVYGKNGETLMIEIAPLNNGETFYNLLINMLSQIEDPVKTK